MSKDRISEITYILKKMRDRMELMQKKLNNMEKIVLDQQKKIQELEMMLEKQANDELMEEVRRYPA